MEYQALAIRSAIVIKDYTPELLQHWITLVIRAAKLLLQDLIRLVHIVAVLLRFRITGVQGMEQSVFQCKMHGQD